MRMTDLKTTVSQGQGIHLENMTGKVQLAGLYHILYELIVEHV